MKRPSKKKRRGKRSGKAQASLAEDKNSRWDLPIDLSLRCATRLRSKLGIDEDSYLMIAGPAFGDARSYVLYTALDEVKKTAFQLMRLREYLSDTTETGPRDRISRLAETQVLEEIRARKRRLLEVLVDLILFEGSNEQAYFRHLLLLEEIDVRLSANADQMEFYGSRSTNLDAAIDIDIREVRSIEQTIDLQKAWYLRQRTPILDRAKLQPGRLFSSMRTRLKLGLSTATAHEKLVLGLTYGSGYGHASASVHYATRPRDASRKKQDPEGEATSLGMITIGILERCHRLLGRPDVPIMQTLSASLAKSSAGSELQLATVRDVDVGDFVVVFGNLAEVAEVRRAHYGYCSYRVRFLDDRMMPDIAEDWFPSMHVARMYTFEQARSKIEAMVRSGDIPRDLGDRMLQMDRETLQPYLREPIVQLWKLGLKDWIRSSAAQQSVAADGAAPRR